MADWIDRELWRLPAAGEYRDAVDLELLLTEAPEPIWPGLMSCDLIPLISNSAGDWLCVRVDAANVAGQIVQWYHGGGDWIPWGEDLAEAILFDALVDRISPLSKRHAVPAETPRSTASGDDRVLRWALTRVADSVASAFGSEMDSRQIAETLLQAEVAEVAVRCELLLLALKQPPRESIERMLGEQVTKISRTQCTEWAFDVDRIPAEYRGQGNSATGKSWFDCQDWSEAARHARSACKLAPELAWPWEILGYEAERNRDIEAAVDAYRIAARCSVFTDQSVRMNTHWESDQSSKFCIARLKHLCPDLFRDDSYLRELSESDPVHRRSTMTAYWTRLASEHRDAGNFSEAYRCYMAAGWDIGAEPITAYGDLLDRIAEVALRCGQRARAEVASTHRRCLRQRYGI